MQYDTCQRILSLDNIICQLPPVNFTNNINRNTKNIFGKNRGKRNGRRMSVGSVHAIIRRATASRPLHFHEPNFRGQCGDYHHRTIAKPPMENENGRPTTRSPQNWIVTMSYGRNRIDRTEHLCRRTLLEHCGEIGIRLWAKSLISVEIFETFIWKSITTFL